MTLFKPKNKYTENMKLIGVHIPIESANRLALYCLKEGLTRSSIQKDLINGFLANIPGTDKLIISVAKKAKKDFKKSKMTINKYCIQLQADLQTRKIPEDMIQEIIKQVKD